MIELDDVLLTLGVTFFLIAITFFLHSIANRKRVAYNRPRGKAYGVLSTIGFIVLAFGLGSIGVMLAFVAGTHIRYGGW